MYLNMKYMTMYMLRGFELDLYLPHEFPYIFAYLETLYTAACNQRKLLVIGLLANG